MVMGMQSRAENVTSGDLYFAHTTDTYDGIREITKAIEQGAMGIVIEDNSDQDDIPFDDGNGKTLTEEDRLKHLLTGLELSEDILYDVPVISVEDIQHTMGLMGSIYYGN